MMHTSYVIGEYLLGILDKCTIHSAYPMWRCNKTLQVMQSGVASSPKQPRSEVKGENSFFFLKVRNIIDTFCVIVGSTAGVVANPGMHCVSLVYNII